MEILVEVLVMIYDSVAYVLAVERGYGQNHLCGRYLEQITKRIDRYLA